MDANNTSGSVDPSGTSKLNGPVGIGTTSPGESLDVRGNVRAYGTIYSMSDPSYARTYLRTWGLQRDGVMYLEPYADLWLTDQWQTTHNMNIRFNRTQWMNSSNEVQASIDKHGNAWFAGTVYAHSYYGSSSKKVKRDIRALTGDDLQWALDALRKARSVRFKFKWEVDSPEEGDKLAKEGSGEFRSVPHVGVIAETLPPELTEVNGKFSGGYNLNDMDGLLVAAIKALDRQNQELKARVEILEEAMYKAGLLK